MLAFAPRIAPKLLETIARFDDPREPIAETCRRVGAHAEALGLPRPGYERVRVLVHAVRAARRRQRRVPSTTDVLLDVAFRVRPAYAIGDHISGVGVPVLPRGPARPK